MIFACAGADEFVVGHELADAAPSSSPTFTPPPASAGEDGGGAVAGPEPVLACMGTECPVPFATCGDTISLKCGTNLMTDSANCGACGVSCGDYSVLRMTSRCMQGECTFECATTQNPYGTFDARDCNALLDDGCETNVFDDPNNCGACGVVCDESVHCIAGRCGCPGNLVDCDGECLDVESDDDNCGACGNECVAPSPACNAMPTNTVYGCVQRECGRLKCSSAAVADCDEDLNLGCASDGCETIIAGDPKNCGGCGVQCASGQECRNDGFGFQCLDPCEVSGLTMCNVTRGKGCKDLHSDPDNCGACGVACALPGPNQRRSCEKGRCAYECEQNFADCNGEPSDGCEVDLRRHPANCGTCGHECDYGAGQPCIEGKCLMVECDAGDITR